MYDEHIKSRLIKDWKFFRENHMQTDQKVSITELISNTFPIYIYIGNSLWCISFIK